MPFPRHAPFLVSTLLAIVPGVVGASDSQVVPTAKPMALQTVMQQRDRDMQIITGALVTDDWVTIARVAPQIARHPQPPISEKMRILGWLGSKAGTFRTFDNEVHDAATSMARAATQADGKAVIAAFAKVQLGCLGCHETFRKPFRDHFHAER